MTTERKSHVAMIEAILFMYGREITFKKLSDILDISHDVVKESLTQLKEEYDAREQTGLTIVIRKDDAQMITHPFVAKAVEKITKKELEGSLTPVAMEVLAIIAYRGPISKIDIEAIRGVNCSFTLRNLLRRGLIERVSIDASKRVQYYQTTMDLLRVLGISSVEELPEFNDLSTDKRIDAILYNDHEEK
jgi:segregation and condensation protein B